RGRGRSRGRSGVDAARSVPRRTERGARRGRLIPSRALESFRLSEVLGGLSLATDLGAGLALETAVGSAWIASRLARGLGLPEDGCASAYYTGLLRFIGCTVGAPEGAALGAGDDLALNRAFSLVDFGDPRDVRAHVERGIAPGAPPARR